MVSFNWRWYLSFSMSQCSFYFDVSSACSTSTHWTQFCSKKGVDQNSTAALLPDTHIPDCERLTIRKMTRKFIWFICKKEMSFGPLEDSICAHILEFRETGQVISCHWSWKSCQQALLFNRHSFMFTKRSFVRLWNDRLLAVYRKINWFNSIQINQDYHLVID